MVSTTKNKIPSAFLLYMLLSSVIILILLLSYGNRGFSIYINQLHQPHSDMFFKYMTHLGDGFILLLFIPLIYFKRSVYGLIFSLGALIQLIFISLGKQVFFLGAPRPMTYFHEMSLHVVDGVKIAYFNTFPSGHTATAFFVAAFLSLVNLKGTIHQAIFFVLALMVALSRVYLMQHFLLDVFAGMWIGYASYLMAKFVILKLPSPWLNFRFNQCVKIKLQKSTNRS